MSNVNCKEIERKFLISEFPTNLTLIDDSIVTQGYLYTDDYEVRIRSKAEVMENEAIIGEDYVLSIKSSGDIERTEIETYVSKEFFESLKELIGLKFIKKEFKVYQLKNFMLEVSKVDPGTEDEYMYTEIEFDSIKEAKSFDPSLYPILGKEITYIDEYKMKNYWNFTRKGIPTVRYEKPPFIVRSDKAKEFINHTNPKALKRIKYMAEIFEKEMGIKKR